MRFTQRNGLGVVVLLLAVVSASFAAGVVFRSFGLHFPYPAVWVSAFGSLIMLGAFLLACARFGIWRLIASNRWAGLSLFAFVCALGLLAATFVSLAVPGVLSRSAFEILQVTSLFLNLAGGLSFAVALLLTGIVPRWVAWVGITAASLEFPNLLLTSVTNGVMLSSTLPASLLLQAVVSVASVVFFVALGVNLLHGQRPAEPASNKRIERTEPALS